MELSEIQYMSIINFTKFFVCKFNEGVFKDINLITKNVKSMCPYIYDMGFVFDESLWPPEDEYKYNNLIQFIVKLKGSYNSIPFRLFLDKGYEQDVILLKDNYWQEQ